MDSFKMLRSQPVRGDAFSLTTGINPLTMLSSILCNFVGAGFQQADKKEAMAIQPSECSRLFGRK
jgi:hypothetical protein